MKKFKHNKECVLVPIDINYLLLLIEWNHMFLNTPSPSNQGPYKVYLYLKKTPEHNYDAKFIPLLKDKLGKVVGEAICPGSEGKHMEVGNVKIYEKSLPLNVFKGLCNSPEYPYCPNCKVGHEYISEDEAECYREFGSCNTEWWCLNWVKSPPKPYRYVQDLENYKEDLIKDGLI